MRTAPAVFLAVCLAGGLGAGPATAAAARATTSLSVWSSGGWRTWWRADAAPARWSAPDSLLSGSLSWSRLGAGAEWATARLACAAPAWRAKLIVVRLDPSLLDLSLQLDMTRDQRPAWTIDRAPNDAILAVNAGQFVGGMPWGWVVREGTRLFERGPGPLSSAISFDAAGRVRWAHGGALPSADGVSTGFQSYPTLLAGDGAVPEPLRTPGRGVSHTHRDARLAIGETRDRRILVVLTRFDAFGDVSGALPLGPTTPEMAAIMGALGASDAMMLDGGISAQMLLREPGGKPPLRWPGMRKVPLALIARERSTPTR
ncbi:MAG TPA: phosphodiester glycosidase family protein [Candidatus Eisenbacteria bacterium]|nr:phosphodiester glycosidase family protein [Candidatus Eisenbacteria bacterium]